MRNKLILIMSIILCIAFFGNAKTVEKKDFTPSTAEIVMERDSKRVLYEKNIHEKKYMASLTKILTAICVIENCDLNKTVTVNRQSVGIEGSSIYLKENERISVLDLLYGLMLRSGNDCAVALAYATSGNVESFVNLMNDTAKKIGTKDSNFMNPHGLHDDNHYTTAYDLALISCYAMQNETFREIVSTQKKVITRQDNQGKWLLINKNKMLRNYEGANGIKTGFTKKAGRCLVTSATKNGMTLISVVLNCGPMWEESSAILNLSYKDYKNTKIIDNRFLIDLVEIDDAKIYVTLKNDVYLPLSEDEINNVNIKYEYFDSIKQIKDNIVGIVNIYIKNNLIFTSKLYSINNINQ